jgi:hypothetical protein
MIFRTLLSILLILTTTMGCAHFATYGGQKPNFSLTGNAAKEEIHRFRLEEDNFWTCDFPCFENDPLKRQHTWESILPLIESVSPEAVKSYRKAQTLRKVQLYLLGVGVGGLVAGLIAKDNVKQTYLAISTIGSISSIGTGMYAAWTLSTIPEIYNRDLGKKFSPVVGWNWSFE